MRHRLPVEHFGWMLLGCAVRFIHFALAHDPLLAPPAFLIDLAVLAVVGALGFRATRAAQIARQYPWLYRRSGPLSWRRKDSDARQP